MQNVKCAKGTHSGQNALCAQPYAPCIMHYTHALCTMHYMPCVMHLALSTEH